MHTFLVSLSLFLTIGLAMTLGIVAGQAAIWCILHSFDRSSAPAAKARESITLAEAKIAGD